MRLFKILFFIVFIGLFVSSNSFSKEMPATIKTIPNFSFVDQNGNTIANPDLQGFWIANFVFTRCQGVCPLLTGQMASLQEKLKSEDNIKLVSFSVDPEHDTPDVLSKYAASYKPVSGKWFFVTTDKKEKMWDFISKGFMLGVGEANADDLAKGAEPVMHSSRFVLVSGSNIIGYYDSNEPDQMDALIQEALRLTNSTRN